MKKLIFLTVIFGLMIVAADSVSAQLLQRIEVKNYDLRWNDAGSGHKDDIALWHPKIPNGYFVFGSMGVGQNSFNPNGKVVSYAFKPLTKVTLPDKRQVDSIVYPTDYSQLWLDKGSGADKDGSVWQPVCPQYYRAMGVVANAGYSKPSVKDSACIIDDTNSFLKIRDNVTANYAWFSSGVAKAKTSVFNLFREKPGSVVLYILETNISPYTLNFQRAGMANKLGEGKAVDIKESAYQK